MDFVTIGNAGNPADTTGYGAVPYTYRMGTYEVSRDMITKANNLGGLGISMADMSPYGGNGVNRPATGVSWYKAAVFVNWLNTSTGHMPAYKFSGGSFALWLPGDAGYSAASLYRNSLATYYLPNDNEWYKAAYYDGAAGVYYDYPTGSDSPPSAVASGTGAGTAVYDQPFSSGPTDIADAGALSPYGTLAQGGNSWEWVEDAWDGVNDTTTEARGVRGGDWDSSVGFLSSSYRDWELPGREDSPYPAFRVAAVPEPLESAGVIGAAALGYALWRRRGSR
jgi:formylglycine-generating enzyme